MASRRGHSRFEILISLRDSRRGTMRLRGFEAWRLNMSYFGVTLGYFAARPSQACQAGPIQSIQSGRAESTESAELVRPARPFEAKLYAQAQIRPSTYMHDTCITRPIRRLHAPSDPKVTPKRTQSDPKVSIIRQKLSHGDPRAIPT